MIDQMKETAGYTQSLLAVRATKLVRCNGTRKAMQRGGRVVLAEEIEPFLQCCRLRTEKEQQPPECRSMQGALIDLLLPGWRDIADHASLRRYDLLARALIVLEILSCERQ